MVWKIIVKSVIAVTLIALLGWLMFSIGQNNIANKTCVHMGFTSGRAIPDGIGCVEIKHIDLIFTEASTETE